jgi:hypothetical protein
MDRKVEGKGGARRRLLNTRQQRMRYSEAKEISAGRSNENEIVLFIVYL